mgnify:CR=1 FL=1
MHSCIEKGDISWFPLNKALSLREEDEEDDAVAGGIEELKGMIDALKTKGDEDSAVVKKLADTMGEIMTRLDDLASKLEAAAAPADDSDGANNSRSRRSMARRNRRNQRRANTPPSRQTSDRDVDSDSLSSRGSRPPSTGDAAGQS